MCPGHFWIDQGNDLVGIIDGGSCDVYRCAQGTVTMLVGWRYMDNGGVQFVDLIVEQVGNVAEEYGHEIGLPVIDHIPYGGAYKKAVDVKGLLIFRLRKGQVLSLQGDGNEFHVF